MDNLSDLKCFIHRFKNPIKEYVAVRHTNKVDAVVVCCTTIERGPATVIQSVRGGHGGQGLSGT